MSMCHTKAFQHGTWLKNVLIELWDCVFLHTFSPRDVNIRMWRFHVWSLNCYVTICLIKVLEKELNFWLQCEHTALANILTTANHQLYLKNITAGSHRAAFQVVFKRCVPLLIKTWPIWDIYRLCVGDCVFIQWLSPSHNCFLSSRVSRAPLRLWFPE